MSGVLLGRTGSAGGEIQHGIRTVIANALVQIQRRHVAPRGQRGRSGSVYRTCARGLPSPLRTTSARVRVPPRVRGPELNLELAPVTHDRARVPSERDPFRGRRHPTIGQELASPSYSNLGAGCVSLGTKSSS